MASTLVALSVWAPRRLLRLGAGCVAVEMTPALPLHTQQPPSLSMERSEDDD